MKEPSHFHSEDEFYQKKFDEHGLTPEGAGWDNPGKALHRYEAVRDYLQECGWIPVRNMVLDVGCGTGVGVGFFADGGYVGVDIREFYLKALRDRYAGLDQVMFRSPDSIQDLRPVWSVAVGLFSYARAGIPDYLKTHVLPVMREYASRSRKGFIFHGLHSAVDYRLDYLYYFDLNELVLAMSQEDGYRIKVIPLGMYRQELKYEFICHVVKEN